MPVDHLFKHTDLEPLENNPLRGNYKLLVVGTFNGAIEGNNAGWFYGRPENEFWCLFPRMLGFNTLHPVDRNETTEELLQIWKQFCIDKGIIIVDLFKTVNVDLMSHADKELETLQADQYTAFDFQRAFGNCHFEKVIFTWVGKNKNTLTLLKNRYINYFQEQGSEIVQLITPSNAYNKSRVFKLAKWKEAFYHVR